MVLGMYGKRHLGCGATKYYRSPEANEKLTKTAVVRCWLKKLADRLPTKRVGGQRDEDSAKRRMVEKVIADQATKHVSAMIQTKKGLYYDAIRRNKKRICLQGGCCEVTDRVLKILMK